MSERSERTIQHSAPITTRNEPVSERSERTIQHSAPITTRDES